MTEPIDKIKDALRLLDDVHSAMVQFRALGFAVKEMHGLPYLPKSASEAASGLDSANAIRSILISLRDELDGG